MLGHTPPFCRPLPGQPRATAHSGRTLTTEPWPGTDGANSLHVSPWRSTISLQIPCLRMKTGLLPGEITHPPLVLAQALGGGPKRCPIKGGMRLSSGTEHHWGDLGPLHAGTKGALCIASWRKRTSNLHSCDRTITTHFPGHLSEQEGLVLFGRFGPIDKSREFTAWEWKQSQIRVSGFFGSKQDFLS